MAGKNRFSVSDRFEFLQGLVTEFQDTDSEGKSMLTYALHIYIQYVLDSVCTIYIPLFDKL